MTSNIPLWGETTRLRLDRLRGRVEADVCVVGLGGSGLACVRALLDAGKRVVGIDAGTVASGAAGRNGGFLLGGLAMFYHDAVGQLGEPRARTIYEETLNQIVRMQRETPTAIRETGSLRIAIDEDELADCARQRDAMQRSGLPVEDYEGAEGRGLLFPRDCVFNPVVRCTLLAEDAMARGAMLFAQSPALEIVSGRVTTTDGEVVAPHIVVAVDGRLEMLLPEVAGRVRSARLQMLGTSPAPEVSWARPVYARWGLDYWQQLVDGSVVVGGFRDAGDDEEWTTAAIPTERVQRAIETLLRDTLGVRAPITHRWAATVGYTTNGMPVLGEVRPGVWAIGGYCGTGNVIGALCGRAVAEILITGSSSLAGLIAGE